MNITFEAYDKIVERGKEYAYDMIQIDKLDDFENIPASFGFRRPA